MFHPGDGQIARGRPRPDLLQRSRGCFTPETRRERRRRGELRASLQRSRGCFTPETAEQRAPMKPPVTCFNGAGVVSPRRHGTERALTLASVRASTEPGLFHPGDSEPADAFDSGRVDRFNGAGVVSPRRLGKLPRYRCPEPLQRSRGCFTPETVSHVAHRCDTVRGLQRSRGCFTPETARASTSGHVESLCFNGAGVVSPRRRLAENGADLEGLWGDVRDLLRAGVVLQLLGGDCGRSVVDLQGIWLASGAAGTAPDLTPRVTRRLVRRRAGLGGRP